MKKLTNSFKISFIRRPGLPPETNEYQFSPKNHHIKPQQELYSRNSHEQILEKPTNDRAISNNVLDDENRTSSARTLKKINLSEANGTNNGNAYNTNVPSSIQSVSSISPIQPTNTNLKEISCKTNNSWSTRKKILLALSAFLVIAIVVVVTTVLAVLLTRHTVTTTTTTSTTTVSSKNLFASWSFDNTTTDLYNTYNGALINGATYSPSTIGAPYIGPATALSLTSSLSQSFLVASPFFDFTSTSFTIEAWIYPIIAYSGDRGIFGQCYCSLCINQCLYIILRSNRLYAGFTLNDISSSLILLMNTWNHIAFVYNYQTEQQILYINGVQDTIKSNAQPYQGINGTIQIGVAQVAQTINYFNGYIDNVNIVTRAKSSVELLTDATLVAYYSFDIPYSSYDNGPNGLNGTLVNAVIVSGRVNQALRFTGVSSYFQAYGLYRFGYATLLSKSFSVSMWINPTSVVGSTFVQMSTAQSIGLCTNMFGFISSSGVNGQLLAQGPTSTWTFVTIFGPFISTNTWTHISWTFGSTNGYILYINGNLFGSTGATSSNTVNQMIWLQIGYTGICSGSYFSNTGYQGSIDEVYFHARELAQADVTSLANP